MASRYVRPAPPLRPPSAGGSSLSPKLGDQANVSLPGAGIKLDSPASILAAEESILKAFRAHPELTPLLFVNPALVLRDLGFELTDHAVHHVLDALAQGEAISQELVCLDKEIRSEIGKAGDKLNLQSEKDTAKLVFKHLQVRPLAVQGIETPYRPPSSKRIEKLRERITQKKRELKTKASARTKKRAMRLRFVEYQADRFLDLDAKLPDLPVADEIPETLPLNELIFYRDKHPLIVKILRYQVLQKSRLQWSTGATYRKIRDGEEGSVWRSWIKAVRYPGVEEDT